MMKSIRNSRFRNLLYTNILAVVVVIAGILAVASPALAAGGGSGPSASELMWQAVNLALLLGVLFAVARKPITAYFAERREQIKNDMKSADKLLAESKKQFSEWQGKLAELEAEVQTIRDETRQRAHDERDQIVAAAHDSAERIRADAVAAVDQELRRAQVELREEAANLAIDLAANMITEQVDDRDRDRLLDEFITRVEPATIQDSGTGN
ncbi:MAG TPA: ATP synthase F0 subunit B [Myxococcales bacterium]|nr:F0F1 ATP synthase subunit B [Myxococcales bacterium]HIM02394.1 ATP synthase F0 subunit B [Myxococcales bacterium]